MVPELSKPARLVTLALLAFAAVAVEIAANDGRAVFQSIGLASLWVGIGVLVARFMPIPANPRDKPPFWVFLLLLALAAAPFALEPLRQRWFGEGYPLELQMVCGLRNVGLGLAACGGWFLCQRLASVVSLFLILFAAAMTNHPAVMVVFALYTAAGSIWLLLSYWSGLKSVFVTTEKAVAVEVQAQRERTPWVGLSVLVLLFGVSAALIVVGPKRAAFALGEWMPTSGGTGETDPFARYGLGDGPEEVAGDDAKAAGMVETEKMIEDNEKSLVDVVSDTYGPPHKPPEELERMVAGGFANVIQTDGRPPESRRPSRDFDTGRKGPKTPKKPDSREARGVLEIEGRTPLHIRLVAYENYDPVRNRWIEARKPSSKRIVAEDNCWMRLDHFKESDWYLVDDRHKLKVADLKSNLVPTSSLTTRFRIDKVDKPDYFEWDYEGVLSLAGRKQTPPGVIVTADCRTLDPSRLPDTAFSLSGATGGLPPVLGELPEPIRPEITRIAQEWAGDRSRGWAQIEAVLSRLRHEYTLDRNASVPADHSSPVLWFLSESHRGPDYLFATAATFLLRSLGYPSRVCLGYYASPDAFDSETEHTPVKETDLHLWPEILLRDGQWLVVEPTPGYGLLAPKLPLSERILQAAQVAVAWVVRNALLTSFTLILAIIFFRRHRELYDSLLLLRWRLLPARTWNEQVERAMRMLQRRGRWAGKLRSVGQTPVAWLRSAGRGDTELARLATVAEWATYAPDLPPPWSMEDSFIVCRAALAKWTIHQWREKQREGTAC
jgi:transglutaminase-like putative cysteine protease